jgi:hypothetical protein
MSKVSVNILNIAGIFLILFAFFPGTVIACDCEKADVKDNLKSMSYVFVGQMVSAYVVKQEHTYYEDTKSKDLVSENAADNKIKLTGKKIKFDASYIAAKFEKLEVFKGDPDKIMHFKLNLTSCGIPPTVGLRYLIFADANGMTNECVGSKLLDNQFEYSQDKDIIELRRLTHKHQ